MNSFEQEALRRAQEMQGRVNTQPRQPQNVTESTNAKKVSHKEASETKTKPMQNSKQDNSGRNTSPAPLHLGAGLDNLFEDKEKLLILLLILILSSEESSDPTLILALLYIII